MRIYTNRSMGPMEFDALRQLTLYRTKTKHYTSQAADVSRVLIAGTAVSIDNIPL